MLLESLACHFSFLFLRGIESRMSWMKSIALRKFNFQGQSWSVPWKSRVTRRKPWLRCNDIIKILDSGLLLLEEVTLFCIRIKSDRFGAKSSVQRSEGMLQRLMFQGSVDLRLLSLEVFYLKMRGDYYRPEPSGSLLATYLELLSLRLTEAILQNSQMDHREVRK